jgi:DNA-binding NarL/FixJ family response regulator
LPSAEPPPRVVLGDDHDAMRRGVRAVLEGAGFEVVAEARDAAGAAEDARRERPDVCLLDVRMPGDGIAAAAAIAREAPDTHVVMLSVSLEEADVFAALRAGASGYLLKDMDPQRLPFAIRGVLDGEAALPRTLTAQLIAEYRGRSRRRAPHTPGDPLTEREAEVLDLLADGRPPAELARRLGISPVTVRRHVSEIVRKLRAADRHDAVRIAREARGDG